MSETIHKKQLCKCENCGNEAEMTFVCTLPDEDEKPVSNEEKSPQQPQQVKGTATCVSCGNEADMWIDL